MPEARLALLRARAAVDGTLVQLKHSVDLHITLCCGSVVYGSTRASARGLGSNPSGVNVRFFAFLHGAHNAFLRHFFGAHIFLRAFLRLSSRRAQCISSPFLRHAHILRSSPYSDALYYIFYPGSGE